MCRAVQFLFENRKYEPHFVSPRARLPVRMRNGQNQLIIWGRRPGEAGNLPYGPGIRLNAIQAGTWDHLLPRPVKIAVQNFMEVDVSGKPHWFQITPGQYIQGVLFHADNDYRVYVVQLDCNSSEIFFEQWPRIVSAPF